MTTQKNKTQIVNLGRLKTAELKPKRAKRRANNEGSIYFDQKKKIWIAQLQLGIHPQTGRLIKKTRTGHTQKEALEKLTAMKEKYAVVTHVDADTMTTGQWLTKWFHIYSLPKIRGNTAQSYKHILAIAMESVGNIRLDKLTDIDLQTVIFGRLKDHYRTAENFRTMMKAALRRAVKSHLLKESPAEDLELPKKPRKRPFVKPSEADWQALLTFDNSCYYCWRWILLMEYVTGARMSEVLALKWTDLETTVDTHGRLTGGTIHIQNALYLGMNEEAGGSRPLLVGDTKTTQGNRILPLPVDICYELLHYRKVQLERRLMTPGFPQTDFIFTKNNGQLINPSSFSSHFAHVRKKLGINTTFHMLRHDMASRMKSTHIFDLKDIQAQLGHSSIQITMDTYTHIDEEQNAKVSCWLESGVSNLIKSTKAKTISSK